jgi:regulator of sigma E protease
MIAAILAALGFMALIVLHELGHFAVAKLVGMRVERFSLFFPPLIWRRQGKGETEFAIGAIPLGGYVKISGMNPHEVLPPEVEHRAYYRQKPWKRVAVILAGPAVNILLAFAIFSGLILHDGVPTDGAKVVKIERNQPAEGVLVPGDQILEVDGRTGTSTQLARRIASHRCEGKLVAGCEAKTAVTLKLRRGDRILIERVKPVYDAAKDIRKMRIGFSSEAIFRSAGIIDAFDGSADQLWYVTSRSVDRIVGVLDPVKRKELHGVVGSYETARSAFSLDVRTALFVLAVISLSLGIVNLFPFLPLDGGHVFWAVAEKIRGRAIPFAIMEKAGFVGFVLVLCFAAIGFTNDLNTLSGPGFDLGR